MYAKSIIEHVRTRLAEGAWAQQVSFVPVLMALAVAALPFTLDTRIDASVGAVANNGGEADAEAVVETPASRAMIKTAANQRLAMPEERRYSLLADYMARKFLVSRQVVHDLVKTAYAVGRKYNIDPTLLVAVIAVESSFNPIAESVAGAKGLMQIIPQFHLEKFAEFGGEQAVFEPRANITVGAKIIREYLQASSGDLFTALQTYAGAVADRDAAYTHKVLGEKDRLDALLGLPRTDRGGRTEPAAAAALPPSAPTGTQPAAPAAVPPKERVQTIIPPSLPSPETTLLEPARVKPAEPAAAAPLTIPSPLASLTLRQP